MDPNAKNNDGDTPLHTACGNESSKQVKLLVRDERCNPHEKNSRGDTALHVACRRRYGGIHYFNYLFCLLFLTTHSVLVVVDLQCNVYTCSSSCARFARTTTPPQRTVRTTTDMPRRRRQRLCLVRALGWGAAPFPDTKTLFCCSS